MKILAIGFALLLSPAMVSAHVSAPTIMAGLSLQLIMQAEADEATAKAWAMKNAPQDVGQNSTLVDCIDTKTNTWTAETTSRCTDIATNLVTRETSSTGKSRLAMETLVQMVLMRTTEATAFANLDDSAYAEKAGAQNMARLRVLNRDAKRMSIAQIYRYSSELL